MILSARFLKNVVGVNGFSAQSWAELSEGEAPAIYFQLVDASKDADDPSCRYMPAAGASLQVTVDNIDDARKITRFCSQPYPQDPSIWQLTLMTADGLKGTCGLKLVLSEALSIKYGYVQAAIRVRSAAAI